MSRDLSGIKLVKICFCYAAMYVSAEMLLSLLPTDMGSCSLRLLNICIQMFNDATFNQYSSSEFFSPGRLC